MVDSVTFLTLLIQAAVWTAISGECGKPAIAPNLNRIVGGNSARNGSWPWQGYLQFRDKDWWGHLQPYHFICGGSLIAPGWFMTAAHCVNGDNDPKHFLVTLGAFNYKINEPTQQVMKVKAVHKYSKFDGWDYSFDLALIEFDKEATLTDHVSTICLPSSDSAVLATGKHLWTTGWGSTSEGGSMSDTLRQVKVPIVSLDTCIQNYQDSNPPREVKPECMFCASAAGYDACQGDSGGPTVQQTNDGRWFQYGIVSWGVGCAEAFLPGVYSRVTDYCQFISSTTQGKAVCQS